MVREEVRQRMQLFMGGMPSSFYISDSRGGTGLYEAIGRIQQRVEAAATTNNHKATTVVASAGSNTTTTSSSSSTTIAADHRSSNTTITTTTTTTEIREVYLSIGLFNEDLWCEHDQIERRHCCYELGYSLSLLQFSLQRLVLNIEHIAICSETMKLQSILQGAKSIIQLEFRCSCPISSIEEGGGDDDGGGGRGGQQQRMTEHHIQQVASALEYHPSIQHFTLHATVESYNPILTSLSTLPQLTTVILQVPRDNNHHPPPPNNTTILPPPPPPPPPPILNSSCFQQLLTVSSLRDIILRGPGIYLSQEVLHIMIETFHEKKTSVSNFILRDVDTILPYPPTVTTTTTTTTTTDTPTINTITTMTANNEVNDEDEQVGNQQDSSIIPTTATSTTTLALLGTALLENQTVQSLSIYNPVGGSSSGGGSNTMIPHHHHHHHNNTAYNQVVFATSISRQLRDNTTVLRNLTIDFASSMLGLDYSYDNDDTIVGGPLQDNTSYGEIIMSALTSNTTIERLVLSHFFWTYKFSLAILQALGGTGTGGSSNNNTTTTTTSKSNLRHLSLVPFNLSDAEWKIALPFLQTNTTLKYMKIVCPEEAQQQQESGGIGGSSSLPSSYLSISGSVAAIETAHYLNYNTSLEYFEIDFNYQSVVKEYIPAIQCLTQNTTLQQLKFTSSSSDGPQPLTTEEECHQLISAARGNYGLLCHPSISTMTNSTIATTRRRRQLHHHHFNDNDDAGSDTTSEEEDLRIMENAVTAANCGRLLGDLKIIETLNRAGRRYLRQDAASKEDAISVLHWVRDDLNAIFFHLLENPGLCCHSPPPPPPSR